MTSALQPDHPDLRIEFNRLFREFFDRAERKRRWSIREDIPWHLANRNLSPIVADVVESFCAVEMYLPDYLAKALPMIRANRGWAWFHINWGYEESKHSMALGDWLLKSRARTDEQMADLQTQVFQHEWNLPEDSPQGMLIYAMAQELATWVHYRNLRRVLDSCGGDPALAKLLEFIAIDERSHHDFYRRMVKIFLTLDRKSTLEQLKRVLLGFSMPAVYLLAESKQRVAQIKELGVFDPDMFVHEVYRPILDGLEVEHCELRNQRVKSVVV